MKRLILMATVSFLMAAMMAVAGPASATIHPIVESFDCANQQAFANHPLGDPADPPGQTPGYGSHSEQSTLRAVQQADDSAFSEHKLNGKCGKVGQS
jgi:hypothetical protein